MILTSLEMWPALAQAFWVFGTLLLCASGVGLVVWVLGWGIRFRFWQTEEGLTIWAFSLALLLLVTNNVVGNFGAVTRDWWEPPVTTFMWWVFTRFAVNAFIFWTIWRMLGILRRHWHTKQPLYFEVPSRQIKPKDRAPRRAL